jgi:hypothetical protein
MGIVSYNIINFIDACSAALIPVLNTVMGDSINYIEIESKEVKKLLYHYIEKYIKDVKYKNATPIIVNTCLPFKNYRNTFNNKSSEFVILKDSNLKLSRAKLQSTINSIWTILLKKKHYICIRLETIDSLDLTIAIKEKIGKDHIEIKNFNFKTILDSNVKIFPRRYNNTKLPGFVFREVAEELINLNVIL